MAPYGKEMVTTGLAVADAWTMDPFVALDAT
jgi:hypothetical protein